MKRISNIFYHVHFIDVNKCYFLGDNIVEASNTGIKNCGVSCFKNQSISISGNTQLKFTEN